MIVETEIKPDLKRAYFWITALVYTDYVQEAGFLDISTQTGWNSIAVLDSLQRDRSLTDNDLLKAEQDVISFVSKKYPKILEVEFSVYSHSMRDMQSTLEKGGTVVAETQTPTQTPTVDSTDTAEIRDAQRIRDIINIALALGMYWDNNNHIYPTTLSSLVPKYLLVNLKDPLDNNSYLYDQVQGGTSYELGANLEKNNPKALSYDGGVWDYDDSVVAGGNITSGADDKSCTGAAGRYCYNITPD